MPRKVVSGPDYDYEYDDYDEDYDETGYGINQQPAKEEKGMLLKLLAPCFLLMKHMPRHVLKKKVSSTMRITISERKW
jgi:hypothetical protein